MKKDWASKAVEKLPQHYSGFPSGVRRADVAPLLRAERRRVVLAIQQMKKDLKKCADAQGMDCRCYLKACDDILKYVRQP